MKKRKISIAAIVCAIPLFLGCVCLFAASWYLRVFGDMGFNALITTLTLDTGATSDELIYDYLLGGFLPAVITCALIETVLFFPSRRKITVKTGKGGIKLFPLPRWLSGLIAAVLACVFIVFAAYRTDVISYIKYISAEPTTFFENEYVDPKTAKITFPEDKQNLIVIYLESMETSFLSADYHGGNDINPMPELCRLAEENTNFSQNETVGGFTAPYGGNWTIAALVSFASGAPLKLPADVTDGNAYGGESFLPGLTTINNILKENGYYQSFMCGSDATFGGRSRFYIDHGIDDIFDLFTAREEGIVPKNYEVWWGMEDLHLFRYAKEKLTEISKGDKPFAFSMLTVDTHHIGGYRCRLCKNQFPEQYENVIACSSRQIYSFVEWIKRQDFYENTTIVILGDHPTMDNEYAKNNLTEGYDRKVYNCFINSRVTASSIKNREVTSFDMFPSILAALGCEIEGDRLGLGVNLFSDKARRIIKK